MAASAGPWSAQTRSYTSRASRRSGKPIMPLAWAVRRSTAKWVLPVLVGPRTALTGWDEGDGMVFRGGDAGMGGVAVQKGIDGWRRIPRVAAEIGRAWCRDRVCQYA